MIKLGLYSHTIDYAGTWRSHERIAEVLQHNPEYDVTVFYTDAVENNRLDVAKKVLHACKFVPFERSHKRLGPETGYVACQSDIDTVVKSQGIDVFHFARSGYYEWPLTTCMAPVQVETNIFGYEDPSEHLDGSIVISESLRLPLNDRREVIYNPIPRASDRFEKIPSLRSDLGLSEEAVVFGRIGRPSNFTPISLIAFSELVKTDPTARYVIVGPCEDTRRCVSQLGLSSEVVFLDPTNDDDMIERFHKTIDVFAHYRSDGETFGTAIAQAMMYGIPVITHYAGQNGQALTIGRGDYCVSSTSEYLAVMMRLIDRKVISDLGNIARDYAQKNYDQKTVVDKIDAFYRKIGEVKGLSR